MTDPALQTRHGDAEGAFGSHARAVYRGILDNLDLAVAVIDLEGVYLEQNRRHGELLGFTDEELTGKTPAIHLGDELFASVAQELARAGRFSGDVVSTAKSGQKLQLTLEAFTLHDADGSPICHVGIKRDPRRDEATQESLRRSVSLLQASLDSTADGLLIVNRAGGIVRFNKRFAKMWGLSEQALATGADSDALAEAVMRVRDPEAFIKRVQELYDRPEETSFDTIEMADGRVFERYSRPQRLGDDVVGRVWSFRDVTLRSRAEDALRHSEERYRRLFTESRHAIYLTTRDGVFVDANPAALELFGIGRDQLGVANARDHYVDPDARAAFQEEVERTGSVKDFPVSLTSTDGRLMHCMLTSTLRKDAEGNVVGYHGIIEDVTERTATEKALRASEAKFRSLIEHASDTITVLAADGEILYESPSLRRVLGYDPDELIGRNVFEFLHRDDIDEIRHRFRNLLATPDEVATSEMRFRHADGSWRIIDTVARNLLHDEDIGGVVVNARDITGRKAVEAQLLHDAFHDKLTQLPNRALFMDRVSKLLQRSSREDADEFAVLFLDLDRFKVVNDSLGHMIGDQLLVALAKRLARQLRPGDTVARLGGDEFTMLLDGADAEEAAGVAERVQRDLETPFRLGPHHVYATVSIGISTSATPYQTPEEMLRDADVAMYRSKDAGRAQYSVFDASMRASAVDRLRIETDLRRALERREFEVYYQPIVRLDSGSLHGFEALLRWRHGSRGLLSPGEFLNAAEETGLILPIGWWVIEEVCEQISRWVDMQGPMPIAPPVQVNVSASQMARAELLYRVSDALDLFGTPPHLLHLELTESTMMENAESTVSMLEELKKLQVGLSIDDFGTGYSSLSYLHRFPTDSVKIDRSFVSRMGPLGRESEIVRTIVDLAHDLGMHVVAEGIETESHAALLRGMRCEFGQGYLFSRPLKAQAATELLLQPRSW